MKKHKYLFSNNNRKSVSFSICQNSFDLALLSLAYQCAVSVEYSRGFESPIYIYKIYYSSDKLK